MEKRKQKIGACLNYFHALPTANHKEHRKRPGRAEVFHSHFPFSVFSLLISVLESDFARPSERRHRKCRHRQRVRNRERNHPSYGTHLPLPPSGRQTVHRKDGEKRSHRFVEKLPRDAPECARRCHRRPPEQRHNLWVHAPILVRFFPFGYFCLASVAIPLKPHAAEQPAQFASNGSPAPVWTAPLPRFILRQ
jgi:hypothetical protein